MKNDYVNKAKRRAALIGSGRPDRQEEDLKPVQRRLQIALRIVLLLLVVPAITAQAKQPQESGHIVLGKEISDKGLNIMRRVVSI